MDALSEAASIIADMDRYSVVLIAEDYDIHSKFNDLGTDDESKSENRDLRRDASQI